MASVRLQGETIQTNGELPRSGAAAPAFVLTDKDLSDVRLEDYRGHTVILNAVPSLDTPTCLVSTRKLAAALPEVPGARLVLVSADLPFAQGRVLHNDGLNNVEALSMMRDREFAIDYGLLIVDGPLRGISARALLVIDTTGVVRHAELVEDIAQEPDYEAALTAVRSLA